MRLLVHLTAWLLLFNAALLVMSDYQRTHWCELPGWAGPWSVKTDYCSQPDPRSEEEKRPHGQSGFASDAETLSDNLGTPGRRIVVRRLQ